MSPKRRPQSVLEVAVANGGVIKARRALLFAVAWLIQEQDEGATPTMEGYTRYWGQSTATSYRERDAFRACFPKYETPTELAAAIGYKPTKKLSRSDSLDLGLFPVPT